jgi:heme exporter protein C
MKKAFVPLLILGALMFAYAPVAVANTPYESTMLLIQKVFYFHLAAWAGLGLAISVCGISSAVYLANGSKLADRLGVAGAELVVVFCTFGMMSGSLWARKAWGIWWGWDPKLTLAFIVDLVFVGYILVRRFGGPGAEKLAAAMGIFGLATTPFIYKAADWWRTIHPQTSVMKTLSNTEGGAIMWSTVWFCIVTFLVLTVLVLAARTRLEALKTQLDELYLAAEES